MKILIALSALFVYFNLFAQEKKEKHIIDSLENVLINKELSKGELSKLRIDLASELVKFNPKKGDSLAQLVINDLEATKPSPLLVNAHLAAAENQFYLGSKEGLEHHIEKSLNIGKENGFDEELQKAYTLHFNCYSRFNRAKAYKMTQEAIAFAESQKAPVFLMRVYGNRAVLEYNYIKDLDEATYWFQKEMDVAKRHQKFEKMASVSMNLGVMFFRKGELEQSMSYYKTSLQALEEFEYPRLESQIYINIGLTMEKREYADSAIYYFKKSAQIAQDNDNSDILAHSYKEIGRIHKDNARYEKSITWSMKALRIYDSLKNVDYKLLAVYHSLMLTYKKMSFYDEYKNYIDLRKNKIQELGDSLLMARSYRERASYYFTIKDSLDYALNLLDSAKVIYQSKQKTELIEDIKLDYGNIYHFKGDHKNAKAYYKDYLSFINSKKNLNKIELSGVLLNIGVSAYKTKDYKESLSYLKRSLEIRKDIGKPQFLMNSYDALSDSYEAIGDYKKAYENLMLYEKYKGEVSKQEKVKDIAEIRTKYESEKKEQRNRLLKKENALTSAELEKTALENERNQTLLAGSVGGGILVVILGLVSYRGYLRKRKDNDLLQNKNEEISNQHEKISQKNTEIMDSIRYAQRIQETILPDDDFIQRSFSNSFIYFNPKEHVSGDFYWMKSIDDGTERMTMFSAIDCTGHGVPGAFVSIVGHHGLNRAVNEFKLRSPKLILEKLNKIVVQSFVSGQQANVKDGMDLALCSIDENGVLHYAGANNPLWIVSEKASNIQDRITTTHHERVRSKTYDHVDLTEIKADKRPIGYYEGQNVFVEHHVKLQKGDTIYVFSDGYADQFGGEKNKKMKTGRFKELLASLFGKPMKHQRDVLHTSFNDWMGDNEQIDDVCVIGFRYE